MKRAAFVVIFLIVCTFSAGNFSAVAEEETKYEEYGCLYDVSIRALPNGESAVLFTIPKNTIIKVKDTITSDSVTWCLIMYNGQEGYVEQSYLYLYIPSASFTSYFARVTATRLNDDIYAYEDALCQNSVLELHDGKAVLVKDTGSVSSRITVDGNEYYIKNENLTTGLTYYRKMALIISVVCIAAVIGVLLLAYLNKNRIKRKKA